MQKLRNIIAICLIISLAPVSAAGLETPDSVVPGGHTIGVKLYTGGLWIIGMSPVVTKEGETEPARRAGLAEGDIVTHINGKEIKELEKLSGFTADWDGAPVHVRFVRDGKMIETEFAPALCARESIYKLGIWVRDSMAGIGTLTFYEPESGLFGSLGHGISDSGTGKLIPLDSGYLDYSEVESVLRGEPGIPGELHGIFRTGHDYGDVLSNTDSGLFGIVNDCDILGPQPAEPVMVGPAGEVSAGPAVIRSNVEGDTVGEYQIEILKIYGAEHESRNFMLRVTDPLLLEKTGGIVQGMSGSPVLQNGKLIGAVTHVLVGDPKRGYGIFIETMLREGGGALEEAQDAA